MSKAVIIILSFIFVSLNSFALSEPLKNLTCVTEFPTTTYIFDLEDDQYVVDLIHHNGIEHAPLYDGLLTLATIDYLQKRIENIKTLGPRVTFKFDKSDCSVLEENRITCYKKGSSNLGSLNVDDVYFNVHKSSNSSTYGVFENVNVTFQYRQKGQQFKMPMNYPANDCMSRF